jgi:DNA-binding transcriptional ArsR family regulator
VNQLFAARALEAGILNLGSSLRRNDSSRLESELHGWYRRQVITLGFGADTLAATRLSVSPAMEAVTWVKLTATARRHPVFGDPGPAARGALRHPDVALIADLIPPEGATYFPDLLTPKPTGGSWKSIIADQIAEIESTTTSTIEQQVYATIAAHWGRPVSHRIRRLVESGQLARRLASGIAHFWKETLNDDWSALQAILDGDINERAKSIAAHGIGHVLGDLHPRIGWTRDILTIDTPYHHHIDLAGHGFVLAPTILSWPETLIQIDDTAQMTLYYPANQIGNGSRRPTELSQVIGDMRAKLLSDLGTPRSTAELAARHRVSASTVSYHLAALHRANLVSKHRDGRHVLYQRTQRADLLVDTS